MKLILIFFCFAVLPAEQRYLFDLVFGFSFWWVKGAERHWLRRKERTNQKTKWNQWSWKQRVKWSWNGMWANCGIVLMKSKEWNKRGNGMEAEWSPAQGAKCSAVSPQFISSTHQLQFIGVLMMNWWGAVLSLFSFGWLGAVRPPQCSANKREDSERRTAQLLPSFAAQH